jgi:hypothetical protein
MTTNYTPEALNEEISLCKAAWKVHLQIEPADKKSSEYSAWMKHGKNIISAWYNARQAVDYWNEVAHRARKAVI